MLRLKSYRLLVAADRCVEQASFREHVAEIDMSFQIIRPENQRCLIARDGLVEISLILKNALPRL